MNVKPGDKITVIWHGEPIEVVIKAIKDGVVIFE